MADSDKMAHTGPPPVYGSQTISPQSTGGPYYQNQGNSYGPMVPYNHNNQTDVRAPDQAYSGYQNQQPQGFYAPQNNVYGQPGYGPPQGGFYGPQPPPQQQMYYAAPYGPPAGYVQDSRGPSAAGGICAGILGACAFCCCLDLLF